MTFGQEWDTARYNYLYWVSYFFMLAFPALTSAGVALFFDRALVRRILHCILASLCFFLTLATTAWSIGLKWDLRAQAAHTVDEQKLVALRDTGNLAFSPIIGAFCGLIAVGIWLFIALLVRWLKCRPMHNLSSQPD